jgi:hypothetical protein
MLIPSDIMYQIVERKIRKLAKRFSRFLEQLNRFGHYWLASPEQ